MKKTCSEQSRRILLILLLISIAVCASSCFEPHPPTVECERVIVERISAQKVDLSFRLKIENPNAIEVEAKQSAYILLIKGNELFSGTNPGFKLKAHETSMVSIPISLYYHKVFQTTSGLVAAVLQGEKEIPFIFKGQIDLHALVFDATVPFETSGTIPLPGLADIKL